MQWAIQGWSSVTRNGTITQNLAGDDTKPFANCATDFTGPFYTIQGRGRVRVKRYLCLFVCLQTHCCHLEKATSLETDVFLNTLTQMVTRQGWPKLVLSDNGTNYVGAAHEIKELVKNMDQEKIKRLTSNQGINRLFNPPRALHFGGVLESNYLFLQLKLLLKEANTVFLFFRGLVSVFFTTKLRTLACDEWFEKSVDNSTCSHLRLDLEKNANMYKLTSVAWPSWLLFCFSYKYEAPHTFM